MGVPFAAEATLSLHVFRHSRRGGAPHTSSTGACLETELDLIAPATLARSTVVHNRFPTWGWRSAQALVGESVVTGFVHAASYTYLGAFLILLVIVADECPGLP